MFDPKSALTTADLLARRAAELGKLPNGTMSSLRKLKSKDHTTWTEEDDDEVVLRISELSQAINPETEQSLKRGSSKIYRLRLISYSAIMVIICFAILYAIINLSLIFSPLKSVATDIEKVASENIDSKLFEYTTLESRLSDRGCGAILGASKIPEQNARPPDGGGQEASQQNNQTQGQIDDCANLLSQYNEARTAVVKFEAISNHNTDILESTFERLENSNSFLQHFLSVFSSFPATYLTKATQGSAAIESSSGVDLHPVQRKLEHLIALSSIMEPITQLLGVHILPLLYGMLGATVYMLRSIVGKTIGLVAIADNFLEALLRVGLGGIAGLAIGWFNIGTEAGQLTTTPFAVAFVAGFSIDILFSLLERVVNVFSTKPST